MNASYTKLARIWNRSDSDESMDFEKEILELLSQSGINPRQDDGGMVQINLSIPTSIEAAFVIGLRYIKKNKTYTEDHFLCRRDAQPGFCHREIESHYRRKLESLLPEYGGTHKQKNFSVGPKSPLGDLTIQVNTISFLRDEND